ncbi:MAG: hypothetical protein MUD01_10580 [Chloroflexaceae bacterium]|jgi:hypothetical protein|nr:hypothetical protein [Chloroflexaceae bacterium]
MTTHKTSLWVIAGAALLSIASLGATVALAGNEDRSEFFLVVALLLVLPMVPAFYAMQRSAAPRASRTAVILAVVGATPLWLGPLLSLVIPTLPGWVSPVFMGLIATLGGWMLVVGGVAPRTGMPWPLALGMLTTGSAWLLVLGLSATTIAYPHPLHAALGASLLLLLCSHLATMAGLAGWAIWQTTQRARRKAAA